jgi:UDP-glucuronate 4-epimerase
VESIERLLCKAPVQLADSKLQYDVPSSSNAPFRILNIGNGSPVALMKYVNVIEKTLGMQAKINFLPLQPGDVQSTFANCQKLERLIGFRPKTNVETGIAKFIKWYLDYHGK